MKLSNHGIDFIKHYEGFSASPYLDAVGIPTIGYGITHYDSGRRVSMADRPISEFGAMTVLKHEINKIYGHAVNTYVQVPITQNQFDALTSFTYNEGPRAFKTSTMLKYINEGKFDLAQHEFRRWTKAGGRILKGLQKRREAERRLFVKDINEIYNPTK